MLLHVWGSQVTDRYNGARITFYAKLPKVKILDSSIELNQCNYSKANCNSKECVYVYIYTTFSVLFVLLG